MKTIKINFIDFSDNFDYNTFLLYNLLKKKYNVEISNKPDYIFFGDNGYDHLNYNCIRIYCTGENKTPNFNQCDYAVGFHYINFEDRYLRLPLYVEYDFYLKNYNIAIKKHLDKNNFKIREKFCNMVVSNGLSQHRIDFYNKLNKYKQTDSGGRILNNVGGPVNDKLEFQKQYKFSLAFENTIGNGYTTEKLVDAFAAGGIPIYFGDPKIGNYFNKKAFINYSDFKNEDELIKYIEKLDKDDNLYLSYIKEPMLKDQNHYEILIKNTIEFLTNIFDQDINKAKRRCPENIWVNMEKKHYLLANKIVKTIKPLLRLKSKIKNKLVK